MRILITQRVEVEASYGERRDALDQAWVDTLQRLVGRPPLLLPLVNHQAQAAAMVTELEPDLIVLSGGADFGIAPERDNTELQLLNLATQWRIPVLGVCRGMQMMHLHAGGRTTTVTGHVSRPHRVSVVSGNDGPAQLLVNSFHNHGIEVTKDGAFRPLYCVDGATEAFRHRDLPWCGVMWHPERPGNEPSADAWLAGQLASLLRR